MKGLIREPVFHIDALGTERHYAESVEKLLAFVDHEKGVPVAQDDLRGPVCGLCVTQRLESNRRRRDGWRRSERFGRRGRYRGRHRSSQRFRKNTYATRISGWRRCARL